MGFPAYSFRVVWNVEDEVYVASCSDFPGVSGFGATADVALKEAQFSLELAIESYNEEGWALPEVEQVAEYSGQFRLRVPREMHALLAQRAADEGVSLNTYVLSLIANGLGQSDAFQLVKQETRALVLNAMQMRGRGVAAASTSKSPLLPNGFVASSSTGGTQWPN